MSSSLAQAQEMATTDWRDTLKTIGNVYSDDDNPVIQSVKIFGRVHGQWNYSDGELGGRKIGGEGEELRRLRAGFSVNFLDGFKALARWNLEEGTFEDTQIGYDGFDELYLSYGRKNWLGFDSLSAGYGRYKLLVGGEEHQSSKRIKTIERSAINNRFGSRRPTGLVFNADKSGVEYIVGIWSTEFESATWADWEQGVAVQTSAMFEAAGGDWILDFVYSDDPGGEGEISIFNYDWVTSITYNRQFGQTHLLTNFTVSEAGSSDPIGIVILPSHFIIPDKLEAVARYQWAHVRGDRGAPLSSSSRGIRGVAVANDLPSGAGDTFNALYGGFNYYIAGDNLKLMSGVQYEKIDGDAETELDGLTVWIAIRAYF